MARARNIKPGFYKNEDLAECSVWARLLFPGLWMLADREGRLEDRPKRIKGEIFPFDTVDVEPLLLELQGRSFILRYQIDGASFIQILRFKDHQAPHYSEKKSVIKPPPFPPHDRNEFPESAPDDEPPIPENYKKDDGIKRGSQPPDSLNPDSLNPEPRKRAERGTRLPAAWTLPEDWEAWAKNERPELDPQATGEKFADYWHGIAGSKGVKLDWLATWRNWVREERAPKQANGHALPPDEWWKSDPGTVRKGKEIGLQARGGETYSAYRSRIFDHLRENQHA